MKKNIMNEALFQIKNHKHLIILGIYLILLSLASFYFFDKTQGDTISYLDSIQFLQTGISSSGFTANRILTTFGGLQAIILLSNVFSSITVGWFILNHLLFFLSCFVIYRILFLLFDDKNTSLVGVLFFAGSYATINFGLAYILDMGGWAFYIFSLYFCFKYILEQNRKYILFASILVGVGTLFKEYAALGSLAVCLSLVFVHRKSFINLLKNSLLPIILGSFPILILYIWAYFTLDYTYLDWFATNDNLYSYSFTDRIIEYIKSFGSLFNILGILFIFGLYALGSKWGTLDTDIKAFLVITAISFLPIFFWPAVTQRILFVTMPFVVIVASFFINKFEKKWIFIPALLVYVFLSFMTDYLLYTVNLPF